MLACSRIAAVVAADSAEAASNLPGSALVAWVSHPLDDTPSFKKASLYPLSRWSGITWSHPRVAQPVGRPAGEVFVRQAQLPNGSHRPMTGTGSKLPPARLPVKVSERIIRRRSCHFGTGGTTP